MGWQSRSSSLFRGCKCQTTVFMAAVLGGVLPLLAKKMKIDPAIMAAPLITTIVDAAALAIYFGIAVSLLSI